MSYNDYSDHSISKSTASVDLVIEQWYRDPYERNNPDGPAHTKQRRLNLENAMKNKGFAQSRVTPIVNWLLRCNGLYKDYDNRRGREKGGCRRENPVLENPIPKTVASKTDTGIQVNEDDCDGDTNMSSTRDEFEIEKQPTSTEQESFNYEEEEAEPTEQELKAILGTEVDFEHTNSPDSTANEEQRLIQALKHRLRFWDIIYGDDLSTYNHDEHVQFSWFRSPVPKPIRKLKTQGHHPLQKVVVNGQEYLTEDPAFGITFPKEHEETTKQVTSDSDTAKQSRSSTLWGRDEIKWLSNLPEHRFSAGYREIWKEIAQKSGLQIVEKNGEEIIVSSNSKCVLEQV